MKFTSGDLSYDKKIEILTKLKDFKIRDNEIFLQGGTLLGAVREHGLIDHDDDIDIVYLSKYHTIPEIKKEMLEIYQELIDKGIMYKYFDTSYSPVFDFNSLVDGRGQCHIYIGDMLVDLWTSWIDEDGDMNFCDVSKICKQTDILPLRIETLYDIEFKVPKEAEKLLEKIYGPDWKIPQQKKPSIERKGVL